MDGSNQKMGSEDRKKEKTNQGKKPKLKASIPSGVTNFCYGIIPLRTGEYPLGF
jgi:hypothetical protein